MDELMASKKAELMVVLSDQPRGLSMDYLKVDLSDRHMEDLLDLLMDVMMVGKMEGWMVFSKDLTTVVR